MIKFFRKHNRKLLAIFMALLLIVWLGGSALTALLSPSTEHQALATTRYGVIEDADRSLANFETGLLDRLGIRWRTPWVFTRGVNHQPLGLMEWIMLTKESQQWGMMPRQIEVDSFLSSYGLTPEDVHRRAAKQDVKVERIYAAVAKFMGVFRTLNLTVTASIKSEAEMRVVARNELDKVRVNLVAIPAASLMDAGESFSTEQMQEHFQKYRAEKKGPGVEFGYFQPPRIKVQYCKVSADVVAANLRIRDKTLETRAREYWREHKRDPAFRKPDKKDDKNPKAKENGDTPDAGKEKAPPSPFFETFEEARDVAVSAVRKDLAGGEIDKVTGWLQQALSEPWFAIEDGEDGYKVATDDLLSPDHYQAVLDQLPPGRRFGNAVSIHQTGFFSQDEALEVPDIGMTSAKLGSRTLLLRQLPFHVQGVEPIPSDRQADLSLFIAVGQTSPVVLRNDSGDQFVFRVLAVHPAGPADNLEQVRDQVVEDLRLAKGYERAKQAADRLPAAVSSSGGLKAAWDAADDLKGLSPPQPGYYSPEPFARRRQGMYGRPVGTTKAFLSGVGLVGEDFVDGCFSLAEAPKDERIKSFHVDGRALAVVVEWVGNIPLRSDAYDANRERLVREINEGSIAQAVNQWLDPARIRDRNGFEDATP